MRYLLLLILHNTGSGAFGEVYEGRAVGLIIEGLVSSARPFKVAVKTLRKGATPKDKAEFLKEAQVMSSLHHENVLRLIGVCLDNDPHFLITELMEGGDLTTFLKWVPQSYQYAEFGFLFIVAEAVLKNFRILKPVFISVGIHVF